MKVSKENLIDEDIVLKNYIKMYPSGYLSRFGEKVLLHSLIKNQYPGLYEEHLSPESGGKDNE